MQEYTDTNFGFSFQYPTSFSSDGHGYVGLTSVPPSVIITPNNAISSQTEIDSNGCYTNINTARESGPEENKITINNLNFCESIGADPGAGSSHDSDYYTTSHNGNYITIGYQYGDSCGAVSGEQPQEQLCVNAITAATQLIRQSVGTLQFAQ